MINGVTVHRASSVGIFLSLPLSPDFIIHFYRLIKLCNLAHFHVPFPLAELAYVLTKPSVKTIASWHSDIVRQKIFKPIYYPFLKSFLCRTSVILVPTVQHIHSSPLLSNYTQKCLVVPFGIDPSRFALSQSVQTQVKRIREKFGKKIILSVGRLVYYKGFEYLISAMTDVDACLIIVGNGPKKVDLYRKIKELKLEHKVFILSDIPDSSLLAYYHSCDVFVLPSIEPTEAFGLVQLEAMACGKPVVNTNLSTGVPLVSKHGETGLTVPPRDSSALAAAINYLLKNPDVAERFGQRARQKVQDEFNVSLMIERIYKVYVHILEGSTDAFGEACEDHSKHI
ncbi:MAG: glycosyltransferase [Deltaproteobacteria bacterium]|nr:glycosyltransferase [Deltaproteobacteria bacterium]